MKVTKVYKKGIKNINEDAYVVNDFAGVYAAIDGATGLDGVPGHIASQVVRKEMEDMDKNSSIYKIIHSANKKLENKMVDYYVENIKKLNKRSIDEIPKKQRSTTGLATIQIDKDNLFFDYIHTGDCMLFLKYENGEVRTVTYDLIQYLDKKAIDEMVRLRSQEVNTDLDIKALKQKVNPILLENRDKLNTTNGYGVLDGSIEAMNYLEYGKVSLMRVDKILLLSDGLLLPTMQGEKNVWEKTADLAFSFGLDGLLKEVEKREFEDKECRIYPRLKQKDDKTGVLLEL